MTIISSQHYIDWNIVEEKMKEIQGQEKIEIPCSYVGLIDGVEYAMQNNGHHTLAAAREMGIPVEFVVKDDCEGLAGKDLLEQRYNDGDWYYVETSRPEYEEFRLVW